MACTSVDVDVTDYMLKICRLPNGPNTHDCGLKTQNISRGLSLLLLDEFLNYFHITSVYIHVH